jgi:uncharacterized protein
MGNERVDGTYAGVIWRPDLRYDPAVGDWRGHLEAAKDAMVKRIRVEFLAQVKQTYRVLLTCGLKGCYVYCMDPETRSFLWSRIFST